MEIEQIFYLGPLRTIMRFLTQMDGELRSYFYKVDERQAGNTTSSLKHMPIVSHTNEGKDGKIKAHLPFEENFVFAKQFKK